MNPKYPIYIVSKGRADSRLTIKTLDQLKVAHYVVIEEEEYGAYAAVVPKTTTILILDKKYQREYETFDDLGETKSKGPGAARNFAWDHAIRSGAKWHWVMDDNIQYFFRFNKNLKVPVSDGTVLRCMEDFSERYDNVAMSGPAYFMFVSRKSVMPPFVPNTRIYSCNLIRNDIPFRWRGRYNEDTDLSLQILKAGRATIQFNAFLQGKITTQVLKGGNTADFYSKEGTRPKSEMLARMHPDVARVVFKFGRVHHHVNYKPFKNNPLGKRKDLVIKTEVDNYGMKLFKIK